MRYYRTIPWGGRDLFVLSAASATTLVHVSIALCREVGVDPGTFKLVVR